MFKRPVTQLFLLRVDCHMSFDVTWNTFMYMYIIPMYVQYVTADIYYVTSYST